MGNSVKNATITGAFNGLDKTSTIKIIAIVGNERINETMGVKNFENHGNRYATSARSTAKIKEIRNACAHLKKVAKNVAQNELFPSKEKAVFTQSQTDGIKYSFCVAVKAICQTSSKNATAAKQKTTFCKILFFIL